MAGQKAAFFLSTLQIHPTKSRFLLPRLTCHAPCIFFPIMKIIERAFSKKKATDRLPELGPNDLQACLGGSASLPGWVCLPALPDKKKKAAACAAAAVSPPGLCIFGFRTALLQ